MADDAMRIVMVMKGVRSAHQLQSSVHSLGRLVGCAGGNGGGVNCE